MSQRNYLKSNRIKSVKLSSDFNMQLLCGKIIENLNTEKRQKLSSYLDKKLCYATNIPQLKVKISDTKQYHKKYQNRTVYKQYRYYKEETNYLYIQNLTAVQGKPLAGKTFLDTLLHEWLHHYDTYKLKLDSIHTKGFYERLKDLKIKLKVIE